MLRKFKFISAVLMGISQIFLQTHVFTAILIVVATALSHWALAVACVLGSALGALLARHLGYPDDETAQGLYGFNGSLAYVCVVFTFGLVEQAGWVWIWGAMAAVLATLLMRLFVCWGRPAFTFPFVVSAWLFCTLPVQCRWLTQTTPALPPSTLHDAIVMPFVAWGQVNFAAHWLSGVLIFVAMAWVNAPAALAGTAMAVLGAVWAGLLGVPDGIVAQGLYSFSPILLACAFAVQKRSDWLYLVLGVFLAVGIQWVMAWLDWTAYTFGFIAASWMVLWLKKVLQVA